jgi:hypothetical protein
MTAHRRGSPFIHYELPELLGGKPPKPPASDEQGGKGKPRPVTTLAVGEEGSGSPGIITTTLALGEEGANSRAHASSSSTGENPAASQEAST